MGDDSWASIGTNNFNNRSLALNDELTLSTSDEAVTTELANHFLDNLAVSNELDPRAGPAGHPASAPSSS